MTRPEKNTKLSDEKTDRQVGNGDFAGDFLLILQTVS